jgi:potassium-transporting ATPase KdpC subunit
MKRDIVSSVIGMIAFTILCGLVYPLAITGISQVAFPGDANGQQVKVDGKLVGSKLIGQNFGTPVLEKNGKPKEVKGAIETEPDPRYFQSRPSATEGGEYNAAASTFSNRGPNSIKTKEADEENICKYLALNKPGASAKEICEDLAEHKAEPAKPEYDPGLTVAKIPVDAVNTSASGLDPEISQANAWIQAYRIAAVRHLPLAKVNSLIAEYTSGRGLGFSGEPGVNVLELNLALDRLTGVNG